MVLKHSLSVFSILINLGNHREIGTSDISMTKLQNYNNRRVETVPPKYYIWFNFADADNTLAMLTYIFNKGVIVL